MQPLLPPEIVLVILQLSAVYSELRWIEFLTNGALPPGPAIVHNQPLGAQGTTHRAHRRRRMQPEAPRELPSPYSWILLTHVCRSWRQLALATSSLWTHIAIVSDLGVVDEMLRRVGTLPITVTLWRPTEQTFTSLEQVLEDRAENVASLVVPATRDLMRPSQAARASCLESLVFIEPSIFYQGRNAAGPFTTQLEFPVLKHLRIVPIFCGPFTHYVSRTLTSVVLRNPPSEFDDIYAHPPHILAQALVHTPCLEVLDVDIGLVGDVGGVAAAGKL